MRRSHEPIHLAVSFDEKFLSPFYVLLTSIFENNGGNYFKIHAIAHHVNPQEIVNIRNFVSANNAEIIYYEVYNRMMKQIAAAGTKSHYAAATYFRLFFPVLLNREIKKVIYIDVDTVVIGDLLELYNLPVEGVPVAASPDTGVIGINDTGSYFNAGVLLIHLENWRKQKITERSIQYLNKYPGQLNYADQDALNVVLTNNWHAISNRFNLTFNDIPPLLTKGKYGEYLLDKVIIHYTGINKPWLGLGRNRLRAVYHYYLKKSPRASEKKYIDLEFTPSYLMAFLKIRITEILYNFPRILDFLKRQI